MRLFRQSATNGADPLMGKPASWGIHRYLQGSSNLFEENRLLKFAIVGLFGVTSVLGLVIYSSNQNQRTVIVPFGASGDLYVTGNRPSAGYLRTITRNIVGLAGTYSAYSADRQFQELLTLVHPSAYNGVRDSLNAILDELADNPTLSIATYITSDLDRVDHLVPVARELAFNLRDFASDGAYPRMRSDLPDIMLIDVPGAYASASLPLGRYYPVMIETPLEGVEFERFLQAERPLPIMPDLLDHRPSTLQGQEIMLCHYDIADGSWPSILLIQWPLYCTALAPQGDMFARNAYTFELFTHRLDRAKATEILLRSLEGAPGGTQLLSTATESEP